jgi:hypothetical protein
MIRKIIYRMGIEQIPLHYGTYTSDTKYTDLVEDITFNYLHFLTNKL